jgi:hypothetical protein
MNDVVNYEGHGKGEGCLKAVLTSNTNNQIIYPVPWHNFTLTQTGSPRLAQWIRHPDFYISVLYGMTVHGERK